MLRRQIVGLSISGNVTRNEKTAGLLAPNAAKRASAPTFGTPGRQLINPNRRRERGSPQARGSYPGHDRPGTRAKGGWESFGTSWIDPIKTTRGGRVTGSAPALTKLGATTASTPRPSSNSTCFPERRGLLRWSGVLRGRFGSR